MSLKRLLIAALILGTFSIYLLLALVNASQTSSQECRESTVMTLKDHIPGPGWEVIIQVPSSGYTQRICEDPVIDLDRRRVVCQTQVIGALGGESPAALINPQREAYYRARP